jgi:tetratricopeptide (TPR) repeat protein
LSPSNSSVIIRQRINHATNILLGILFLGASCASWTLVRSAVRTHREETWSKAYNQANYAFSRSDYPDAESILSAILPSAEKWWPRDRHLVDTFRLLGDIYRIDHKHQEAESILTQALRVSQSAVPFDNTSAGQINVYLALLYRDQRRYTESEQILFERPRRARKRSSIRRARSRTNTTEPGIPPLVQGRYTEAEPFFLRSTASYEAYLGAAPHPDLAVAIHDLGDVYMKEGKNGETEKMYLKALAMQQRTDGPQSTATISTLNALAIAYRLEGKHFDSIALLAPAGKVEQNNATQAKTAQRRDIERVGKCGIAGAEILGRRKIF